jgi:uroporphyrinogen decarboxylase
MDVPDMRELIGNDRTIQGNLDPCTLYGTHDTVASETIKMLNSFGNNKRHIVNLGHGVYPDVDPEKVKTFIKTVKSYEIN